MNLGFVDTLTTEQKDQIAALISMDREQYEAFERAYQQSSIDGMFGPSAKSAVKEGRTITPEEFEQIEENKEFLKSICSRIVDELLNSYRMLPASDSLVSNADLARIPEDLRPQLTGTLSKVDIGKPSANTVLYNLYCAVNEKNPEKAKIHYGMFRSGLDMLDLDPICYDLLGRNRNSMGYWFPKLKAAADKQEFFKVPKTKIIKVPLPILQLSRIDFSELTLPTKDIVNEFCMRAFDLDVSKSYFIKTGVFSCKFDFRNCKVTGEKEVREIGEYLLYISSLASSMASMLQNPPTYGQATTNEWVVREYIEDADNNPCIYHGLPLRTEYRVFIDCDSDEILGISPYWRPDVMKKRFGASLDRGSPDNIHDYIIYKSHEEKLSRRYQENETAVLEGVMKMLPDIDLEGQWSLDVMQNGDEFYLIDMAAASDSAYKEVIPKGKLKQIPMQTDWYLPEKRIVRKETR